MAGAGGLAFLGDALLRRIKSRARWNGGVRIEHGPATIPRQGRSEPRHACIVRRQGGETIGRRLIAGIEQFLGRLLAPPVAVERPDERAQDREAGCAREAGQHFAGEAHHARALGPETKACGRILPWVVALLAAVARHIVAHLGLPSVRTMRTLCCLSPPRRSSAAAKSRSTM